MSKTASGLVAWAKEWLGQPYWYGTFCNPCSTGLLEAKRKQYPGHYTSLRMARYKADIGSGKSCADCVGLIKGYVWERDGKIVYDSATDVSANGMYQAATEKGPIGTLPETPGLLLWNNGHIGVYIGHGEAIEARGFVYGIVQTRVASGSWTHWCQCPYIEYEAVQPQQEGILCAGGAVLVHQCIKQAKQAGKDE